MAIESKMTASTKKAKENAFSVIDAAITMCDKLSDVEINTNSLVNNGNGPFNFLINIGISLGIYNEMLEWLEQFIIYFMPILENTTKGILLNNLISRISCNEDPRIPDEIRLNQPNLYESQLNENTIKGFMIDIQGIDYTNLLSISPLSKKGKNLYFGNNNNNYADEFARADDMNAFLWYVIHLGTHQQPLTITKDKTLSEYFNDNFNNAVTIPSSATCLSSFSVTGNSMNGILVGTNFIRENGNTILSCIKNNISESNFTDSNTGNEVINRNWNAVIAPLSYNYDTTNWYYDSSAVKISLIEAKNTKEYTAKKDAVKRHYNKEFPILRMKYYNSDLKSLEVKKILGKTTYNNLQNKLQICVLPKPFQIFPPSFTIPDTLKDVFSLNMIKLKYILFDENGVQDKNGHYSCLIEPTDKGNPNYNIANKKIYFKLSNVKFGKEGYLVLDYSSWKYILSYDINGQNEITSEEDLSKILYECYPKLTIYELMTDLIFGMRILDSKTICTELIDSVINLRLGRTFTISPPRAKYIEKVNNIVKNIVESEGTELDDCFFNFSNDRFSEMIEKSDSLRRINYDFIGDISSSVTTDTSAVTDILNEYSDDATKDENKEVIHRAFTTAINTISENITPSQSLSLKCNIITQLLQNLLSSVIINIMSPKIVLLFEMEKQLMGDKSQSLTFEDFFKSISGILIGIINEIGDIIINEFKKVVFLKLKDISACMLLKIAKEKLDNYTSVIKSIIEACSFNIGNNGNANLNTNITNINYADITNTPVKNNQC